MDSLAVMLARKIRQKPLKTFDSRPGIPTAAATLDAGMPDKTGMSRPAPWDRRRRATGSCAAAFVQAVARKIRQKPLKTFDSRPGIQQRRPPWPPGCRQDEHGSSCPLGSATVRAGVRRGGHRPCGRPENPPEALENVRFTPGNSTAAAALAAGMPGKTGMSHPARCGRRRRAPRSCAAAIGDAVARKIHQKPLKTFDSCPGIPIAVAALAPRRPGSCVYYGTPTVFLCAGAGRGRSASASGSGANPAHPPPPADEPPGNPAASD